jgi:hypothetical protein
MVMRMRNALVVLTVLLAGCGSGITAASTTIPRSPTTDPGTDGAYASLDTARDRWESAALGSYHYVFENDCGECGPLVTAPRQVVVWGDERYDPGQYSPSVEEIFDEIEQALDAGQSVDVTFDEELGYPIEVAIDMESRPVDGGTHWVVDDLEPGLPGDDVSTSIVAQAERLWLATRPAAYEYTLSVFCDCPLEGSVVTRVEGDRVIGYDILYDESSGGSISPLAIDEMFSDLADLMASIDGVVEGGIRFEGSARFDPELGYPIWVGLDIEVIADDPILADLPSRLVITMSDLYPVDPDVSGTLSTERSALKEARTRWGFAALVDYSYELTIHAMATADYTGPFQVEVREGAVTSITRDGVEVEGGQVTAYAIDDLFDLIDRHLADGIESAVLYNEIAGYPVLVQLDLDAIAVDGGLVLSIDQLAPIDGFGG